jgi:phosphoribosylglycinamide formyltransferase 1
MANLKVAVLISGRGSNLQSLIDATCQDDFPAEIVLVISNVPGVQGLERAEKAGIETKVINHKDFEDRESFDEALGESLRDSGAKLVCLAGFMRLLGRQLVSRWRDRVINIHPSLLPAFKGLHIHERVIDAGARFSGCSVHFVRAEMDDGPIIAQAVIPVHGDDDAESLAEKVLKQEHVLYPMAVRLIAEGRVKTVGERVVISESRAEDRVLISPAEV